jgi:hypothetical protein
VSDEHPEALAPHSKSDLARVSLVIMGCSIPLFVTAWRFFLGTSDQEVHAAYTFVFGGALLLIVGAAIGIKVRRQG